MTEPMETEKMGRATAIRKFFNTAGYKSISLAEIKEFKVNDPKGYEKVGDLCIEYLGAELAEIK